VAVDGVSASPYLVRSGTVEDAAVAARLHARQIATGFLSYLGPRFLERLYRRVVLWEGGLLLVAVDHGDGTSSGKGEVVGFIASADPTSGLYRQFLLHDSVGAALATIGPLLRTWRKVLETLRHGSSSGPGVGRGPEILAVAVDPESQGKGLGRQLVLGFVDAVIAGGKTEAYVVTSQDNEPALALYRRCGFRLDQVFELHPGTTSVVMQWDLPSGDAPDGPDPQPS
jgi:ribosomal protein S18 acetylase RimI-like enzyme